MLKLKDFQNYAKNLLVKENLRHYLGGAWKAVYTTAAQNPYNNGQNMCDRHNYETCVDGKDTFWDLRGSNYTLDCP